MYVIETVSWDAKPDITDKQMIDAIEAMIPDLNDLPGFRYQSLSKNDNGRWIEIYYWDTAEDAHRSNDLMAEKTSLQQLLPLIDMNSLNIEVLVPLQESRALKIALP